MTVDSSYLPDPLRVALASDPARPRLTFYDDDTGERVELSAQSLAGWVIKTMNLLLDDVGVDEDSQVALHLPLHWLTAVWVMASEACGAAVTSSDGDAGTVDVTTALGTEHFAVSMRPMALPLGDDTPAGCRDYTAEVRPMPDQLVLPPTGAGATDHASGAGAAAGMGLGRGERVMAVSETPVTSVTAVVHGLLAPLAVDGSAVWTRNPDPGRCVARSESEQVTAVVGPVPAELAALLPAGVRHLAPTTP